MIFTKATRWAWMSCGHSLHTCGGRELGAGERLPLRLSQLPLKSLLSSSSSDVTAQLLGRWGVQTFQSSAPRQCPLPFCLWLSRCSPCQGPSHMCKWCLQPWVMTWSESQASVCMSCNVAGDRHAEHTSERASERAGLGFQLLSLFILRPCVRRPVFSFSF